MKKIKNWLLKNGASTMAALALVMGVNSITQACFLCFNQPEMPEEIRKFQK
ncbi:cyclic lactone autoinducer peptide [Tyzzerella sp. OttesenSCG-928-J15]|nr:cyclic lactone autoinducer peptide [Tyzzerella sp. OttesenSCG-928-J15]